VAKTLSVNTADDDIGAQIASITIYAVMELINLSVRFAVLWPRVCASTEEIRIRVSMDDISTSARMDDVEIGVKSVVLTSSAVMERINQYARFVVMYEESIWRVEGNMLVFMEEIKRAAILSDGLCSLFSNDLVCLKMKLGW
jgi:hypothetical protein